jgi:putative transcriptional regulator
MSKTHTIVKMAGDGTLSRVRGGRKVIVKPAGPRTMTEAEVLAAAKADPDNRPLTAKALAGMKPVARVKTLRRALSLTQQEFAQRYHIPLGTLRDWEQGRSQPDQPARAYLAVIARDPEHVRKVLMREPA